MTTGSYDTRRSTAATTSSGSAGTYKEGSAVSWSGGDSATLRRKRRRYHLREIVYEKSFLKKGKTVVVQRVRHQRVYEPKPVEPVNARRVPHPFTKNWTTTIYRPTALKSVLAGTVVSGPPDGLGLTGVAPPADRWGSKDEYKLLEKLKNLTEGGGFNMASFLGAEGKDTVKFLFDTANRIYRTIAAVKRGNLNRALAIAKSSKDGFKRVRDLGKTKDQIAYQTEVYRNALSELARGSPSHKKEGWRNLTANNWLEYHLAVEPLLGDVKAAAEQLAYTLDRPQSLRYAVKREVEANGVRPSNGAYWLVNIKRHRANVVAYLSELPSVAQLSGLMDPEVVVWNAIPLSFVADYFVPIGDWLEARATASHLVGQFVRSDKIETEVRNCAGTTSTFIAGGFSNKCLYDGGTTWRSGSFVRSVASTLNVPLPDVNPLGALTSWQRAATVVALIVNSGKSRFN